MKERRIIPYALMLVMLTALCFFVHCLNRDTWFDDGEKYLCPECKHLEYYSYGVYCVRCQVSIPYSPVDYCYQCAKELDICQRCGRER